MMNIKPGMLVFLNDDSVVFEIKALSTNEINTKRTLRARWTVETAMDLLSFYGAKFNGWYLCVEATDKEIHILNKSGIVKVDIGRIKKIK